MSPGIYPRKPCSACHGMMVIVDCKWHCHQCARDREEWERLHPKPTRPTTTMGHAERMIAAAFPEKGEQDGEG